MRIEVSRNSCIIDEDVDVPVLLFDFLDDGEEVISIGDVAFYWNKLSESLSKMETKLARRFGSYYGYWQYEGLCFAAG
jgi:hypothetical protein